MVHASVLGWAASTSACSIGSLAGLATRVVPTWDTGRSPRCLRADTEPMIRLPSLLAVLAASAPLFAQVPTADPAPKRDRVEERSQDMRKQIDTGKHLMSHVRVAVRLKNGNRLQGVVKDGRLVERVDGLRFVDAQARDAGAGIRLWYSSGRRNYVFVPFTDLSEYEVEERLSQKQLDALEEELQMNETKREEQMRDAQPLRMRFGGDHVGPLSMRRGARDPED